MGKKAICLEADTSTKSVLDTVNIGFSTQTPAPTPECLQFQSLSTKIPQADPVVVEISGAPVRYSGAK